MLGIIFIGTDVETNNIECWTIRDLGKDKLKRLAITGMTELDKVKPEGSQLMKKWIDDISDRETIDL